MPAKYTKQVVHRGEGATAPTYTSVCTLLIEPLDPVAARSDLTPYNCTVGGTPVVARLGFGENDVSACIDACVRCMRHNDVVNLVVECSERLPSGPCTSGQIMSDGSASHLSQGDVPVGGAALRFNITLCSFVPAPDIFTMTRTEKVDLARSNKDIGVRLYSAASAAGQESGIRHAYNFFSKATKLLICAADDVVMADADDESKTLATKCYLNMAMCQLRWQQFTHVAANCKRALSLSSDCRAHHRLGLAYYGLRDLEAAKASFESALKMNPTYKEAQVELARVTREIKDVDDRLAKNLRKMF